MEDDAPLDDQVDVRPFAEQEYDVTSRHVLAARILRTAAPAGTILDIGGSQGLTAVTLPERRIVTVDILAAGVDVIGSGALLPFAHRSFAAAVLLDVLEHVPQGLKDLLVDEAARVADVVVLAGPFDDSLVRAAEARQRELFQVLLGRDHPWLREHAEAELPSLHRTEQRLAALGWETYTFGSNPLNLWSAQIFNSHVALRFGQDEATVDTRKWLLEHFMDAADATGPSYRHVVVGSRQPGRTSPLSGLVPRGDERLVHEAVRRTELSTARVIADGVSTYDRICQEMNQGWSDSVRMASEGEASLKFAKEQWAATAELVRQLEVMLHQAPPEPAMRALEERFLGDVQAWGRDIAGPPLVTSPCADTLPTAEAYARWRAARPAPTVRHGPLISLVTPVFNPVAEHLTECIRSVRGQTYHNWQLVLVDVSDAPHVYPIERRFAELDDRIFILRRSNEGIALNTNAGVAVSDGEWVAFLDHDDVLEPHALASIANCIESDPTVDIIYSDEDKLDLSGVCTEPLFKPDWSPELLGTVNYLAHLVGVRRSLFEALGGLRAGFDGAQDYDFVIRATAEADHVAHISDVLYHWRKHASSTAADVRMKPDAHSAGRRALQEHLTIHQPGAWVDVGPGPTAHRIRYPLRQELVSVVVPFRDQAKLTERCLETIASARAMLPIEVLLVSNQSEEPETLMAMERWPRQWGWVRVLEFDEPFNYQRINNWAARQAVGELLLFLNNDTEALHNDWIDLLAEQAQRAEIGAVGGRLFYPDGTVQHAGVVVGIGGFAEHPWAHLHPNAVTPAGPSYWVRDVLAVTGACLMVGHAKFDDVRGFDERFRVCGGDVDLCLRFRSRGLRNVFTPYVRLIHHEAASRDGQPPDNDVRESLRAYSHYLSMGDPFYNRNLTLADTSCRLAGC